MFIDDEMKRVMVFGTFDMVHPGHLHLFEKAKEKGDYLIVVVAKDMNVKKEKGMFPQNNEAKRLKDILKLPIVNQAVLGHDDDRYKVIRDFKPAIVCLGYDQKETEKNLSEQLGKKGIKVEIFRIDAYKPEKYKSSKLK
jgi:cytidyltransferase-like protein